MLACLTAWGRAGSAPRRMARSRVVMRAGTSLRMFRTRTQCVAHRSRVRSPQPILHAGPTFTRVLSQNVTQTADTASVCILSVDYMRCKELATTEGQTRANRPQGRVCLILRSHSAPPPAGSEGEGQGPPCRQKTKEFPKSRPSAAKSRRNRRRRTTQGISHLRKSRESCDRSAEPRLLMITLM